MSRFARVNKRPKTMRPLSSAEPSGRHPLDQPEVKAFPPLLSKGLRSPGRPLDATTRDLLEPRLGHCLGNVRIHTDAQAADVAQEVHARALTVGQDVAFGRDQYDPGTGRGRKLIAHELTHVIQQSQGSSSSKSLTAYNAQRAEAEREAQAVAGVAETGFPESAVAIRERLQPQPQFDLAIEPANPNPLLHELSNQELVEAIAYNKKHFEDPYSIMIIRDVIGIPKYPAVSDKDLAEGVVRWQAAHGLAQDGKLGEVTVTFIIEELQAEGDDASAVQLMSEFPPGTLLDVDMSFCECQNKFEHQIEVLPKISGYYKICAADPTIADGQQLIDCVKDKMKEAGMTPVTGGSTSPTARISIAPVPGTCGPLLERLALAHEQIHRLSDQELMETYGQETEAYFETYSDVQRKAKDEAKAYQTAIAFCKWVLSILRRICP